MERLTPRGWLVVEKEPEEGRARFKDSELGYVSGSCDVDKKTIHCLVVHDRDTLSVFLHEVGHATLHNRGDDVHTADEEYEAETFSFAVMRGLGIAVPRSALRGAKGNVINALKAHGHDASDDALKFAYGKNWRDYR